MSAATAANKRVDESETLHGITYVGESEEKGRDGPDGRTGSTEGTYDAEEQEERRNSAVRRKKWRKHPPAAPQRRGLGSARKRAATQQKIKEKAQEQQMTIPEPRHSRYEVATAAREAQREDTKRIKQIQQLLKWKTRQRNAA